MPMLFYFIFIKSNLYYFKPKKSPNKVHKVIRVAHFAVVNVSRRRENTIFAYVKRNSLFQKHTQPSI